MKLKLILLLLVGLAALEAAQASGKTFDLLESLTKNYDRKLRPNYGTPTPVQVNVSAYVIDVHHVSEAEGFQVKFDFYFRQAWNDPRLAYEAVDGKPTELVMDKKAGKDFWLPDTFISSALHTEVQQSVASRDAVFIRLRNNGDILYSTRLLATVQCSNHLALFPFDQQKCKLEFESYGFNALEVSSSWIHVQVSDHQSIEQLRLIDHQTTVKSEQYSTGPYRILLAEFNFARSSCHYISHYFLPAALLVACSWIVFWLHPAGKLVKLVFSSVLVLLAMQFLATAHLPESQHFKAIDIYLFVSFGFILLALIESCAVAHQQAQKQQHDLEHQDQKKPFFTSAGCGSRIDCWSRRLFPAAFVAFNLIYVIGLRIAVHAQEI